MFLAGKWHPQIKFLSFYLDFIKPYNIINGIKSIKKLINYCYRGDNKLMTVLCPYEEPVNNIQVTDMRHTFFVEIINPPKTGDANFVLVGSDEIYEYTRKQDMAVELCTTFFFYLLCIIIIIIYYNITQNSINMAEKRCSMACLTTYVLYSFDSQQYIIYICILQSRSPLFHNFAVNNNCHSRRPKKKNALTNFLIQNRIYKNEIISPLKVCVLSLESPIDIEVP